MNKLEVKVGGLKLRTPLLNASGCGGHSDELSYIEGFDFNNLGAFVTKGVTLLEKQGNPHPRIAEVRGGMLNSIGLQNKGLNYFMEEELPKLEKYNIPIIVNLAADSVNGFETLFENITYCPNFKLISGIEINVSCPNVAIGGLSLGVDTLSVESIAQEARYFFQDKYLIMKLTPNVTDIVEIAKAAIDGGIDALSMINTIKGCAVDINTRKFILGKEVGGFSGPAIKPVGLNAVRECFTKIDRCKNKEIPIIGVGGIINYKDVLEYLMVGASAVQIGTGLFLNSNIFKEIKNGLDKYLSKEGYKNINEVVGCIYR